MIKVLNLRKCYGESEVLRLLSFEVGDGEVYGLLGPNGSGKTTTINILCSLLAADGGQVLIDERPVSEATKYVIGVVPQDLSLYGHLTCIENLNFFASLYGLRGMKKKSRMTELINQFRLESYQNTVVSRLSGGWKRRLNIAVAMVHSPKLLLLDEPTVGLDVDARYELWELLRHLNQAGVTILLTTHYLDEAEKLCSRIGILKHGRIVVQGTREELLSLIPAQELAVIETQQEKTLCQRAATLGIEVRYYGSRLTLLLPQRSTLKKLVGLFEDIPLRSISLQPKCLEHVYLELLGEGSTPRMKMRGETVS